MWGGVRALWRPTLLGVHWIRAFTAYLYLFKRLLIQFWWEAPKACASANGLMKHHKQSMLYAFHAHRHPLTCTLCTSAPDM